MKFSITKKSVAAVVKKASVLVLLQQRDFPHNFWLSASTEIFVT